MEKGPIPRPGRRSRTMAPMAVPSHRRLGLCNILFFGNFGFWVFCCVVEDSVSFAKGTRLDFYFYFFETGTHLD